MHTPVLLKEVIESLNIKPGGRYIDATLGEGGHAFEIAKKGGIVLGIDQDENQLSNLISNVKGQMSNVRLVRGNFADIEEIARSNGFFPVEGVLFDLGLSMRQLEKSGKGFSYKNQEEPLDMRIGDVDRTAEDLINSLGADELYEIFAGNAEEINSRAISEAIARRRRIRPIRAVGDLTAIIKKTIGRRDEKAFRRIFQALRIEVNHEFENLRKGMRGAYNILKNKGRMVIITFHSLEDRIVKNTVRENRWETRRIRTADFSRANRFERSAVLRVIIKNEIIN